MGGLDMAAGSSLDRLKTLDSRPNLEAQLEEAKRLCTHRVRADMVCKWILERLKQDALARASPDMWRTFLQTARMLWPERLGSLLRSFGLMGIIQLGVEAAFSNFNLIFELREVLLVLYDISKSPRGPSLQAVFSMEAQTAAVFIGAWFRCLVKLLEDDRMSDDDSIKSSFVTVALRVWAVRKQSLDENTKFTENCLVPICTYLSMTRKETGISDLRLRKRGHELSEDSGSNDLAELGVILAKQVCLPCRAGFFSSQEQPNRASKIRSKSLSSRLSLYTVMEQFTPCLHHARPELLACLPVILEIALRYAPANTPRQRVKERPWIEALWQKIFPIIHATYTQEASRRALLGMLTTIGNGGVLSTQSLAQIVDGPGGLNSDRGTKVDWGVLAKAIEIDPDWFADAHIAGSLFAELTSAISEAEETSIFKPSGSHTKLESYPKQITRHLAKELIVIPLMKTFARHRKLHEFVDLWEVQLRRDNHNQVWSVWANIDPEFALLVEPTLSDSQMLDLVSHYQDMFVSACREANDRVRQPQLSATVFILNAIVHGLHNERVLDQLQPGLEQIVLSCALPSYPEVSPIKENTFWALAKRSFELWFSLWAYQQNGADVIIERGTIILSSAAMLVANDVARHTRASPTDVCSRTDILARDVRCFVTAVCHFLHDYPALTPSCERQMDLLVAQLDSSEEFLFIYPDVLTKMSQNSCRELVNKCVNFLHGNTELGGQITIALLTCAIQNENYDLVDDLIQNVLKLLNNQGAAGGEMEKVILRILTSVPANRFTRQQRERLLDVVSSLDYGVPYPMICSRLGLMVQLMELSNPSCALSNDPTILRRLARSIDINSSNIKSFDSIRNGFAALDIFAELVRLVLQHLLSTQEQDRSQQMLMKVSGHLSQDILVEAAHVSPTPFQSVTLHELETNCKIDLALDLKHKTSRYNTRWVSSLLHEFNLLFHELTEGGGKNGSLQCVKRLLIVVRAFTDFSSMQVKAAASSTSTDHWEALASTLEASIAQQRELSRPEISNGDQDVVFRLRNIALARVYWVLCKISASTMGIEIAKLAEALLELQLEPTEHEQVISAFEHCVAAPEFSLNADNVKNILMKDGCPSPSALLLLPHCIKRLDKQSYKNADTFSGAKMLHKLIQCTTASKTSLELSRGVECINVVLKDAPFLVNQHGIETILIALPRLARKDMRPDLAYSNACSLFSSLFLHHRARLQGRYHIVTRALQQLLSQLFTSNKTRLQDGESLQHLTAEQARRLARLLTLLCEPLQRRMPTDVTALVDEARKEQARAGQFVPVVLHQYCVQMLHGRLGDGMKDALTPGLWSMIEAMELYDKEGVRVLGAAMNDNERAVLRGVYEEWRRFGKWRGG